MTICFFSAQYLPTNGGVERYTYNIAKRLSQEGNHVVIVTSALPNVKDHEVTGEGIEIFRLPARLMIAGRFPVPQWNRKHKALMKLLQKREIDIIIIMNHFYLLSLYAAYWAKKRNIPMMVIEHGTGHLVPDGKIAQWIGHIYEHFAAWYLSRVCKHFYGVSKEVCTWLKHFRIQAEGVLYNAVDVALIEHVLSEKSSVNWRKDLGLKQDTKLVLYAGRLIPEKGVRELISAIDMLSDQNTVLVLAGDGPMFERLRQEYDDSERIKILGRVEHDALLTLYEQADVLCLPSYSEGFPTTLLEAAACGCAQIASDVGGVRELICSDEHGVVLPSVSVEIIADAIDFTLQNDVWRKKSKELLRRQASENFDWSVVSEKFILTAQEIAANQRVSSNH